MATELSRIVSSQIFQAEGEYQLGKLDLRRQIDPLVEKAKVINITDSEDYDLAVALGRVLTAASQQIDEFYSPVKKSIDAVKQIILTDEKYEKERTDVVKKRIQGLTLTWVLEQNRIKEEQEKIAREIALKEQEEQRIQEAILLESEGDVQAAEQVLNEDVLPPPVITQAPVKAKGQVIKTKWFAEVTDKKKLIRAVADGKVPMEALEVNQSFLNNQAVQFRKGLNYDGVESRERTTSSFRSR